MKATELPELRAKMLAWLHSEQGSYVFQQAQLQNEVLGDKIDADRARLLHAQELSRWLMCELFFVSAPMVRLALTASETIPEFSFIPADLPAEYGLMVFESPIGMSIQPSGDEIPMTSVLWGPTTMQRIRQSGEDAAGVWLSYYTSPQRNYLSAMPLAYDQEGWLGFDQDSHPVNGSHQDSTARWAIVMRCAWLLMQQTVASVTDLQIDRAAQRRIARHKVDQKRVRVIRLRHSSPSGNTQGDREYHYQWVVRGHWRKQWYPSQRRNVPIWISPHVKGPDGAPLLGGEKVYAWTR